MCGLVKESIGKNRKAEIFLTKVLPRFEHHLGTVNGVNIENYGGENGLLGGMEQGNIFSGVECRDESCIMSKNWKIRN